MEIAILLLLSVSLIAATPLRPTHRSDAALPADAIQASERKRDIQEQHAEALKIIPFHSEDNKLDLDALRHRYKGAYLRLRRAAQPGCKLGTCQLNNLANTLYHLGRTHGKDESRGAHDPRGYGR
uniref:Uncharacterized protein n=1 Tax=Mola mola TaxID=94237 RepID=A0A3Q4ADI2_MOLML